MTSLDWLVLLGAATAIVWVNWYFFLADRAPATVTVAGGAFPAVGDGGGSASSQPSTPEVVITVQGGYEPRAVRVRAGRPVRLVFDRQETSGCSEEVVFGDFGIRRFLPAHQKTTIEVTPPRPGTYEFTCGMSMLRGKLIAE